MDGVAWHITSKIKCFDNVTSSYVQEPNLVAIIAKGYLSNRCFKNYEQIVDESSRAWSEILSQSEFIRKLSDRSWIKLV